MDRREAIKRTATIMGGVIFAPSMLGVLRGCNSKPGVDWNPQYFNNSQARLITVLSDIIIPDTDTPGSITAGVPAFIEEMVYTAYHKDDRDEFLKGLETFNQLARDENGKDYINLDPETQFRFADAQNRAAISADSSDNRDFFLIFKELTLVGYFTSKIGAVETLGYVSIPGRYEACIPLSHPLLGYNM